MAAQNIKGAGMLWVTGNISNLPSNPLTEESFLKWYDVDHIAEIVATSGIKNAFRCFHADKTSPLGTPDCPKPYLAFYPMEDLAFTQGDEFKKIRVKSDYLPGTGIVFDMADLDVGYFGLVGKSGEERGEEPSYFIVSAIEPSNDASEEDVNTFFDQQAKSVSKAEHYQRSLRFRLLYARTNAQSRALKGLPTTDAPTPEPPTWLALHTFSEEPTSHVRAAIKADDHALLKKAKQIQTNAYRLQKVQGQGRIFEDDNSRRP